MSRWKPYNPNPRASNVGDCTVRAISKALNTLSEISARTTQKELTYWRLTVMWYVCRTGIIGIRGIVGTRYQYITGRDKHGKMQNM